MSVSIYDYDYDYDYDYYTALTLLMKIFQTNSVDVVQECQTMFNFRRVSELILERCKNFARVKMAYVKFLLLWRRMSCHRCVPR